MQNVLISNMIYISLYIKYQIFKQFDILISFQEFDIYRYIRIWDIEKKWNRTSFSLY